MPDTVIEAGDRIESKEEAWPLPSELVSGVSNTPLQAIHVMFYL